MDWDYTHRILGCAYKVHNELGPGLVERAYEIALEKELLDAGFKVERQREMHVRYKDWNLPDTFRVDLLVDNRVVIELKSVKRLQLIHRAQLLTYLKQTGCELGYVINFNVKKLKNNYYTVPNPDIKRD